MVCLTKTTRDNKLLPTFESSLHSIYSMSAKIYDVKLFSLVIVCRQCIVFELTSCPLRYPLRQAFIVAAYLSLYQMVD